MSRGDPTPVPSGFLLMVCALLGATAARATDHELHLQCTLRPGEAQPTASSFLDQVDSVFLELSSRVVHLRNSQTGKEWALTTGRSRTPTASDRLMLDQFGDRIVGAGYQATEPYAFTYERATGVLAWTMIGAGQAAAQTWAFFCKPRG